MFFQLLHHYFNRFFQLRITALTESCGIEVHFDIRLDAVIFHFPLPLQTINGRAGRGDVTAVDQFRISSNPNESTPSFLANQLADAGFAEIPGQRVSTGTGHFVNDHYLRPENRFRWV